MLTDFANMAAVIVESLIKSVPEPDSPLYWLMLGSLLMLLALLMMWLLVRMRRARLAKEQAATPAPEMSFSDVSAEAAAQAADAEDEASAGSRTEIWSACGRSRQPRWQTGQMTPLPGDAKSSPPPAWARGPGSGSSSERARPPSAAPDGVDPEDDVFLLGLEQEMLATRQLYLDGLISKEVYVTETRALYDKAQSRMT